MASLFPLLSLSPFPQSKIKHRSKRHGVVHYVPCRASNEDHRIPTNKFDRRDLLFGLGGLYGAAAFGGEKSTLADPMSPDMTQCEAATITDNEKVNCCQPLLDDDDIIDFVPPVVENLRVRPAAHSITQRQLAKLEEAVAEMKLLDENDPRSFYQQANLHCAYCNNAYKQDGFPNVDFEIHWNWLFFPFHRCYLYFYERILGSLIDDPDFVIPFWNWDSIPGMTMPTVYTNQNSSLYDELRDPRHVPPKFLDLNYDGITEDPSYDVLDSNLRLMYRQMVINGKTAESFYGKSIRAGEEADTTGMGSIENSPHNIIHAWCGDPRTQNQEDMGNFYSAARDPLFFCHHANVDRLWTIWKASGNDRNPREITDPDWLNASFVFYDENKNAVRIKVRDCLENEKLGYVYERVEIPWMNTKPIPLRETITRLEEVTESKLAKDVPVFPQVLDKKITVEVNRGKISRSETEKSEEDEVLVIDVAFDASSGVHFNVLVNDDGLDVSPGSIEFAGSFKTLPHGHKQFVNTSLSLVITELIEEMGFDDDESVFVTIDPKLGGENVAIEGIKIELRPIN